MKNNRLWFGFVVSTLGITMTSLGGQLVTDELDVFGDASFYGEVNVGWNDAGGSLTNGLVLYYSFNTNSGSSVYDQSGNANDGAVTGATWSTNGFSGGSYYFDGNDHIDSGDILDLSTSVSSMTVCAWFKLPSLIASDMHIISKSETSGSLIGWEITKLSSHLPFSRIIASGAASYLNNDGLTTLTTGIWHFVCATFKRHPNYLETSLYLNGIKERSTSAVGSYTSTDSSAPLTIGARNGGATWHFTGMIDEVRIYNRILADNEITGMYSSFLGYEGSLNVKDLIVDNKIVQSGTNVNVFMGPTGIGVTNPVGQLQVGGMLNMGGNIRLNGNWLSGDGDNEGVSVSSSGTVTILRLQKQGDIEMGIFTNQP